MKIAIIAFDLWGFNKKIADYLTEQGHEVSYLDSTFIKYEYKNFRERFINFLSKTFLRKNRKKMLRNQLITEKIKNSGYQDITLIVNPGHFGDEVVRSIREMTNVYLAYNYDSIKRVPLLKEHKELFDRIYSFDIEDQKKHHYLIPLTNFNYLEKNINLIPENKAFTIISQSKEREEFISRLADVLEEKNYTNFEFIIHNASYKDLNSRIIVTNQYHSLEEVLKKMENSEILIDLVRKNQSGLSFRFFEAMALHKKVITNNPNVVNYDFYNPKNILIIDPDNIEIPDAFLNNSYQELPEDIYNKYTLSHWIETVFGSDLKDIKN